METFYVVEEYIDAGIAIGGKGFWYELPDSKTDDSFLNSQQVTELKNKGRDVRAVEITKMVRKI